jgi:hypothetical protein
VFANFGSNSFRLKSLSKNPEIIKKVKKRKIIENNDFILNTAELS